MTTPFLNGVTVTFLTETISGVDADGNDVSSATQTVVPDCAFNPGGSQEILGTQDTVIVQPTVFLPPGSSVPAAVDRAVIAGITYDVDGSPNSYTNPWTGWTPGPVVKLKAVTG